MRRRGGPGTTVSRRRRPLAGLAMRPSRPWLPAPPGWIRSAQATGHPGISRTTLPRRLRQDAAAPRARGRGTRVTDFPALPRIGNPLILPNVWDVASARCLVHAGFPALGTTSLGVAAATGLPDGAGATAAETVHLTPPAVPTARPPDRRSRDGLGRHSGRRGRGRCRWRQYGRRHGASRGARGTDPVSETGSAAPVRQRSNRHSLATTGRSCRGSASCTAVRRRRCGRVVRPQHG